MSTPTHSRGEGTIPLDEIIITERLRRDDDDIRRKIEEHIVPSIVEHGLIQPIILNRLSAPQEGQNYLGNTIFSDLVLIAGWSRLQSFAFLGYASIPYNTQQNISEDARYELELDENLRRNEMRWQDVCRAIEKVHLRRILATNTEAKETGIKKTWSIRATGYLLNTNFSHAQNALFIAARLNDPEIANAESIRDAIKILQTRKEDEAARVLKEKTKGMQKEVPRLIESHRPKKKPALPKEESPSGLIPNRVADSEKETNVSLSSMLYNLDSIFDQPDGSPSFMSRLEDASVDCIYTDPPFGINMKDLKKRADIGRVDEAHDVSENLNMMPRFFREAYRVLKDKSYFLGWYDMCHHEKILGGDIYIPSDRDRPEDLLFYGEWKEKKGWLQEAGFTVCQYPMVWHKTHSCKNQANHCWPTKTIEYVWVARKGTASLKEQIMDCVFSCSGAQERKLQSNPFAKPFDFTKWLLDPILQPGSVVLDPYAGEGSGVRALLNLGHKVIACEKNPIHFNRLVEHVKTFFESSLKGKVTFS